MVRSGSGLVTAPRPEAFLPVEAHGTLRLDIPGGRSLDLKADGDTLCMDLPGVPEVRAMMPRSFRSRRRSLRFLADTLSTFGLTLRLDLAGKSILRVGAEARPSWLARLLGLGPAYVPFSAVLLLLRRRSA